MAASKFSWWLLLLPVLATLCKSDLVVPTPEYKSAIEELSKICLAICSQHSVTGPKVFVFSLYGGVPHENTEVNFLWKLPYAHVYSAKKHFILRESDREVEISFHATHLRTAEKCSPEECEYLQENIAQLNVEKRIHIKIRKDSPQRFAGHRAKFLSELSQDLRGRSSFQLYRTSFVLVWDDSCLLASFTVARSNRPVSDQVVNLIVSETEDHEAGEVFGEIRSSSNQSAELKLDRFSVSFGADDHGSVNAAGFIKTCARVSSRSRIIILVGILSFHCGAPSIR